MNDEVTPLNETTPILGLNKPLVGGDDDIWGGLLNANADTLDTAIGGLRQVPGGALIGSAAPVANPGALWWDSAAGQLYVRYDDGNSQQWVAAAAPGFAAAADGPVVNVLAHGAKGDGTTDDTAAIQTLLNTSAGHVTVYVPDTGQPYMVNPLVLPSGTDLVINGTLKLRPGNTNGVLVLTSASNVTIHGHGTLDGNGAAQTGLTAGVNADHCTHIRISDITIQNVGFGTHGGWNLNVTASTDVVIDAIRSLNSTNSCEFAAGCDRCWITNSLIDGNANDFGFSFYGGVTNSGIIGCTVTNTAGGIIVFADTGQPAPCSNITISSNIVYHNNAFGIGCDTGAPGAHSGIVIIGNRCYGNNAQATANQPEIYVDHTNGTLISGNLISSGSGGADACGRGINLGASAPNTTVSGNHISAIGSAGEAGTGVHVTGTPQATISSNTFADFRAPPYMTSAISGTAGANSAYIGNDCNNLPVTCTPVGDTVVNNAPYDIIRLPPNGSIQAAIDALPASGGMIVLSANTTYVVTTAIASSKPNVHISAPSWNTVIQRGPALGGTMLQLQGTGCLIEGMTFDGNGTVNTTGSTEVQVSGANSRITNIQAINSAATVTVAASGSGCRVDHCRIAGLGTSLSTQRGYGIWAINHVPVTIDHNRITGTGIDAIGVDGPGSIVDANTISGCHCWSGSAGAQLAIYANTSSGAGITVSNNFIGQGGATTAGGIEAAGNNLTITGNTIVNQYGGGIGIDNGHGFTITGNLVQNVGLDMSGNQDGITIQAGVTDFVIVGNRIGDDNATPNMRWPVIVATGASDRYAIVGNLVIPNSSANTHIGDGGTGANKVIMGNAGQGSLTPYVFSAASIAIPTEYSTFNLLNSGVLTITSIAASSRMNGAVKVALPNAAFTFTAGNNINNTVTTVASVPLIMACDATGNWWLK